MVSNQVSSTVAAVASPARSGSKGTGELSTGSSLSRGPRQTVSGPLPMAVVIASGPSRVP
ncbi:MAG: hypothetical protein EA340_05525 [Nitriliruptor sp.]|nr:MAG: hypothetical protein EA340_05525 [Nitriliruptor sp.]TVR17379.1 MAG: hypothetical protein EA387_16570 [Nitriliruptor sp.]